MLAASSKRHGMLVPGAIEPETSILSTADPSSSSVEPDHRLSRLRMSSANTSLNSYVDEPFRIYSNNKEEPGALSRQEDQMAELRVPSGHGPSHHASHARVPTFHYHTQEAGEDDKENTILVAKRTTIKHAPMAVRRIDMDQPTELAVEKHAHRHTSSSNSNKTRRVSLRSLSSSLSNNSAGTKFKSMASRMRNGSVSQVSSETGVSAATPVSTVSSAHDTLSKKQSFTIVRQSASMLDMKKPSPAADHKRGHSMHRFSLSTQRLGHRISMNSLSKFLKPLGGSSSSSSSSRSVSAHASVDLSRCDISLPVPQHDTREKLNHKLRNSSSIISIASYISTDKKAAAESADKVGAHADASRSSLKVSEMDALNQQLLLKLCNQRRVVFFESLYRKLAQYGRTLEKLAETQFSDVYIERVAPNLADEASQNIIKVIPFGDVHSEQMQLKEVIQELSIIMAMSPIEGYARMKFAKVVKGPYPDELLAVWDGNSAAPEHHINRRPSEHANAQKYLVVRMEYGGVDLKHFRVHSWTQAYEIVSQTAEALARGEIMYGFEHRDLHWGNILVNHDEVGDLKVKLIDFTLSRAKVGDRIMFTGLENPNFFKGKGDFQFTTYSQMRQMILEQQADVPGSRTRAGVDWSASCLSTNLLWIRYVLDRVINHKGLCAVRGGPLSRSETRLNKEAECCSKIMTAFKLLDPDVSKKSRRRIMRSARCFEDFHSAGEFSAWFREFD